MIERRSELELAPMISRIYKVLGSEDRLNLFLLLSSGISTYNEVNQHLRTLSPSSTFKFYNQFIEAGLVKRIREGVYELTPLGNVAVNTIKYFGEETKKVREETFKQELEELRRRYGLDIEEAKRILNG